MRNLDFTIGSPQSIKIGDSNDTLSLRLTEWSQPVDLSKATSITVKIGNTSGFITEINIDVSSLIHPTDGIIDVVIDSKTSSELPAGQYLLEVWINDTNGNTSIFPDTSYPSVIGFSIEKNIMEATSTVITTLTLADFESKFDNMQNDLQGKVTSGYFKGDKGDTGPQGPQGPKGDTGAQGLQGPQGNMGGDGISAYQVAVINGYKGSQAEWLASIVGATGLKGEKGNPGKDFRIVKTFPSIAEMNGDGFSDGDFTMIASDVNDPDDGKLYVWNGTSFTYIADLSGSQGIKGDTGSKGDKGDKGDTGEQGLSAYQVAVNAGFSGSVSQWLESLVGAKGDTGESGKDAVINIVTQAQYDSLADKSGVYFIEG